MGATLPPGVGRRDFEAALRAFESVVGESWVLASDEDCRTYLDAFALVDPDRLMPSGGVAPASVEEIQEILRIANEYRIPLWPVSTGKNLAYGGSCPRMRGTMVLDLVRMNRILEVNDELAYCVVEPGVTFFDMERHLDSIGSPLWMSMPAPGWGSLMGNALDRGIGYTDYGEHAANVCGMEVVLANGDVVRTGMGAMAGNNAWQLYRYGYGPSWQDAFMQSNFGVVTKIGMWLKPEPGASARVQVGLRRESDLAAAVDVLRPLRLRNIVNSSATIASPIRQAAGVSMRSEWYDGDPAAAMPRDAVERMIEQRGTNRWWLVNLTMTDETATLISERLKLVLPGFEAIPDSTIDVQRWDKATGTGRSVKPDPNMRAFQMMNWRGGPGGHVDFSPVVPTDGRAAEELYQLASGLFFEHGFDYFGGFTFFPRHMINTSVVIYNKDDERMRERAMTLFGELMDRAARRGLGAYRTHLAFMDRMADKFDYNDHALGRLNARVKDALDPNGILAPGKQGVWPQAFREWKDG